MTTTSSFGELPDGSPVTAYRLTSGDGLVLTVLDLGATVQSLTWGEGQPSIVIGYDDVAGYLSTDNDYQGAVVGRYANRVAGARFTLDGVEHRLDANDATSCLHGGHRGYDRRVWALAGRDDRSLTLELESPDGDQGFPGNLRARARYELTERSVTLTLTATCDRRTVVNLTNHSYFNLAPGGSSVDSHTLEVQADQYLPVDGRSIPVGHLEDVTGTPFDLRTAARIGDRVRAPHPQVRAARGIDHSFQLRGSGLRPVAVLAEPASGRRLTVLTDQPALQVYTGNFLTGRTVAGDRLLRQGDGIALETQRHPDAPNQPALGPATLEPGDEYRNTTVWQLDRT
ncbi:aldose epimerase family protein [Pedococcus bigeumensis]|uniref:aldose epimerase family protein n=1 Tax=Pedococcus bigeumensis TaxID=433644 RepID=UPI002FEC82D4